LWEGEAVITGRDSLSVYVIGSSVLIKNKIASGRQKDLDDAE
jgi:hypothetical protein